VLRAQNRWEEAVPEYEMALASNPNFLAALFGLGQCKLLAGSIDEVIPLMEQGVRRSPRDPQIGAWYGVMGVVHLLPRAVTGRHPKTLNERGRQLTRAGAPTTRRCSLRPDI